MANIDQRKRSVEEIAKGKMPMGVYLLTHKEAKMDTAKAAQIKAWTDGNQGAADEKHPKTGK